MGMMERRAWGLLLLGLAGMVLALLVACGGGDSSPQPRDLTLSDDKLVRSEDGKTLILEGEVVNGSDREIPFVRLKVRFYDSLGNLVKTGSGNPEPARLEAQGRASFRIQVPYDPAIAEYRVEFFPEMGRSDQRAGRVGS